MMFILYTIKKIATINASFCQVMLDENGLFSREEDKPSPSPPQLGEQIMNTATVTRINRKAALPVDGIEPYIVKEGEEYMGDEQLAHFRAILVAWRKDLQQGADRTVNHMKKEATNFSDPADRATQEEEFALELRTRDRERKLINKISKTIIRVDDDDYGFCDACGIEIGLQRLEVRPTAELCIDCKTTEEIKERQLA